MGSLGRCLARSLPRGQPGLSPPGPRCYGSGETRPRPCPAPGDPVPIPVLPLGTLSPPLLQRTQSPSLGSFPVLPLRTLSSSPSPPQSPAPAVPQSCCSHPVPTVPHPLAVSLSLHPGDGGSRAPVPALRRESVPGSAVPTPVCRDGTGAGSPWRSQGVRCPQGCAGGTGHDPGKAEPFSAVPGDAAELMGSVYQALSPPALGPPGLAARDGSPKPGIGSEVSSLFLPLLPVPSVPAADGMRCPLGALPLLRRSRGRASSGLGPCVPRPWIFLSSSGELCPGTSGRGEEPLAPGHGTDIPGLKAISCPLTCPQHPSGLCGTSLGTPPA